jgi:DNA polymerase
MQRTKATALSALREAWETCTRCGLHEERNRLVFGAGNSNPCVLFVGEGPGENEDRTGEPFCGKAGQRLRKTLRKIEFPSSDCYITNVVKCRPPQDREPLKAEIAACRPLIAEQILILDPILIIGLGKIAASALIGSTQPMKDLRGRMFRYKADAGDVLVQIPMFLTWHPSFIDRQPAKAKEWEEDLIRALLIYEKTKEIACQR